MGCSRELPTTLENEHKRLVFEDGSGGGGAKEATTLENEHMRLVLEDGVVVVVPMSDHPQKRAYVAHFRGCGGGDGAKE